MTKKTKSKFNFNAEIMEVKAKKLASLDISYRIVLETDNPEILRLGELDGDTLVMVKIDTGEG